MPNGVRYEFIYAFFSVFSEVICIWNNIIFHLESTASYISYHINYFHDTCVVHNMTWNFLNIPELTDLWVYFHRQLINSIFFFKKWERGFSNLWQALPGCRCKASKPCKAARGPRAPDCSPFIAWTCPLKIYQKLTHVSTGLTYHPTTLIKRCWTSLRKLSKRLAASQ